MVFIAFLLLTVSTLAVHGKEVSTDGPIIPRGCEGNSLCDEQPADYPQEEIDYFLQNNPAILRRMKREADRAGWQRCKEAEISEKFMPELEEASVGGNCNTEITCQEPFIKIEADRHQSVIVRSHFFSQKIRQVRCISPSMQCFSDFTRDGPPANCTDTHVSTLLYVYDRKSQQVKQVPGTIYVDCACELQLI